MQFFALISTQFNKSIKVLRSDNGQEFLSSKLVTFLTGKGCIQQFSCPYTPQQNGIVERKHRHLLETARALKFQSHIPACFWGDSILTATYIINRIPSTVIGNKSPFEVLFSKPPSFDHMRTFGCLCYATNTLPSKTKFEPRANPTVFLGYPLGQKSYKLFDLTHHKYITSRDVIFHETIFPYQTKNIHNPTLPEDTIPLPQFSTLDHYSDYPESIPT